MDREVRTALRRMKHLQTIFRRRFPQPNSALTAYLNHKGVDITERQVVLLQTSDMPFVQRVSHEMAGRKLRDMRDATKWNPPKREVRIDHSLGSIKESPGKAGFRPRQTMGCGL